MHLVCVWWLKLLLPPNIWFRALEKLDEMRGLGFLAQPSCLHPRFYLGQGKNLPTENHLIKNLLICTFTTADQRRLLFLFLQFWSDNPQFSWLLGSKSKQVHIRKIESKKIKIANHCWYHYIDEEKDAFLQIPGLICFTRPFRELNLSVPAGRPFCDPAELRDAMSCQFWPHSS